MIYSLKDTVLYYYFAIKKTLLYYYLYLNLYFNGVISKYTFNAELKEKYDDL
jgi:hypothetical protein